MISDPSEGERERRPSTLSSLIAGETRRATIDVVVTNAARTARSQNTVSTAKKNSESVARTNPWEEEKRANISPMLADPQRKSADGQKKGGKNSSSTDPSPIQLHIPSRGLCCMYTNS